MAGIPDQIVGQETRLGVEASALVAVPRGSTGARLHGLDAQRGGHLPGFENSEGPAG